MEKNRKAKKNILIVLLLVVVGLSIGFAAFSSTLTIQTTASVTPSDTTFNVAFSSSADELATGAVVTDGIYATAGDVVAGTTTLTGLKANFTAPGQTATWKVFAYNSGEFNAFLNKVTLGQVSATAKEGTDPSKVEAAVTGIKVKISVGGKEFTDSDANVIGHELQKGKGEEILVTLSYEPGSAIADGDFDVTVGDITLLYESVE